MIGPAKRKAIFLLHQEGVPLREISRKLGVHRDTVRAIIDLDGQMPNKVRNDKILVEEELLQKLYEDCDGYAQRVLEKLVEEEGVAITYSTLTRRLRELEISKPAKARCDEVADVPGEMQHDTTVYQVKFAAGWVRVIASLLYLRFSKRRYLKFYRAFNRFRMKCFFHEALMFWGYSGSHCIIDNTNLARLRGTGRNAVMVPEMAGFGEQYGFQFICHEKNHPNRKAGDEKGPHTVETNFLPGRNFKDLEDMNAQAFEWATVPMHTRRQGKTKVIPAEAFEYERVHLHKLPAHLPAPHLVHERATDQYGYIPLDGNYYWVPGTKREDVKVFEYSERIEIYVRRERLAEYKLPPDGVKNQKFSPEGYPKPRYSPHNRRRPTELEEQKLRDMGEAVGQYLDFALKPKGIQRHRLVRELFALSRRVTGDLFTRTLERALRYRITEMETVRRIALLYVAQGEETMLCVEVDENLLEREEYREGRLTETPDLAVYDKLLEDEDENDG